MLHRRDATIAVAALRSGSATMSVIFDCRQRTFSAANAFARQDRNQDDGTNDDAFPATGNVHQDDTAGATSQGVKTNDDIIFFNV